MTWQTSAGSIDASGNLTAPTVSTQTAVTVTATSINGGTPATLTVQVVPLPSITSFTSNPATANYGSSTTMTPVFTFGTGQIASLGSVTGGQAVASGTLTSAHPVLYGGTTTITPQFSQGTGAIDQGIGAVTSGTAYTTGAITTAKTFTLSVTNASGDVATFPLTVNPQTVVVSAITGPSSGKRHPGPHRNLQRHGQRRARHHADLDLREVRAHSPVPPGPHPPPPALTRSPRPRSAARPTRSPSIS